MLPDLRLCFDSDATNLFHTLTFDECAIEFSRVRMTSPRFLQFVSREIQKRYTHYVSSAVLIIRRDLSPTQRPMLLVP
jgi:hypothetical protein